MDLTSTRFSLSLLNDIVSDVISISFPQPLWVIAEVASLTAHASGHLYLDLVEKRDGEVVASARANLWKSRREVLLGFERTTQRKLERGMQLLLLVQPRMHVRYGYSLEIEEIDPTYTLGDMARRKQEAIDRLTREGLLARNRELPFPAVPQNVAVISSATAAGLEDFEQTLQQSGSRYRFVTRLFPALMQGDGAEASIRRALDAVRRAPAPFDCIVLIRGGGGAVDLSCFDSYTLAKEVAMAPLPIVCGIGHQRDNSVCDLVSHHSAATPTAVARYLIDKAAAFADEMEALARLTMQYAFSIVTQQVSDIDRLVDRFQTVVQGRLVDETDALNRLTRGVTYSVKSSVAQRSAELTAAAARMEILPGLRLREGTVAMERYVHDMRAASERIIERSTAALDLIESAVRSRDPADVLRRGYSITRRNGRVLRDPSRLKPGALVETTLQFGTIKSIVEAIAVPIIESLEETA